MPIHTYDVISGYDMAPAFAGMKADSGNDRVETLPVNVDTLAFGVVVGRDANGRGVLPVGDRPHGVTLHQHEYVNRQMTDFATGNLTITNAYVRNDAASVMRRGLVWGRAAGTCTQDGPAKYNPATGEFSDAGSATFPNATFRTPDYAFQGILLTDATQRVVLVELHDPTAAAA